MMLTGKCKEDFEKWYSLVNLTGDAFDYPMIHNFYEIPFSMQYGVYVDFFDSVGQEARTKAIEKANQLYNEV